jgi:hypothetical protein
MMPLNGKSSYFLLMLLAAIVIRSNCAFFSQPQLQLASTTLRARGIGMFRMKSIQLVDATGATARANANAGIPTRQSKSLLAMASTESKYTEAQSDDEMETDESSPADVDTQADKSYSTNASASSSFDSIQNGLGDWEEMHGNYVLRPPATDQEPRYVIGVPFMFHGRCYIMHHAA